ncbi:MAG: hypothetical protein OXC06_00090 [Acidimicrobiaceae bacterium]|nr:hypothetical protein [Acidimicrobiaceae bacterium]
MSSSVSIPADMTQPSDPQPGEPAANPPAAATWRAQRAPAARSLSPTGPLIAIIVLLAGGIGGLMLRALNGLDADIGRLDTDIARLDADIAQFRTDVDTRFKELRSDMDARFEELESDMDARFEGVDARFEGVDARFDSLEAGQAEIASTLAVLVSEMNARAAVDAALSGRLLDPGAAAPEPAAPHSVPAEPGSAQP